VITTTIDDLTPAQRDALTDVRVPRVGSENYGKIYLKTGAHVATRRALVDKGLALADDCLTPDGLIFHQALCTKWGIKNGFEVMKAEREHLDKRAAIERERDVRVKQVAENFRGLAVQPFGVANFEQDDVDLADEIVRYLGRSRSSTIPLTLDHLEAIASLVRRGKLINQIIEVD
jgi:hypothetical protein